MANDIAELRGILFDTLRDLRNKSAPMEIDRAKAISDLAQTVINSAKVEVDHMRVAGHTAGSGFLPTHQPVTGGQPTLVPAPPAPQGVGGQLIAANVHRHELK